MYAVTGNEAVVDLNGKAALNGVNDRVPRSLHRLAAGFLGNVLEWYDFAVYGFFATIIGTLFFPATDRASSLVAAFGAFAIGFVMRPLGAVLFGHIGDRIGRRRLLVLSSISMAFATCAIGLLPTHADIGAAAAFLLVALRMVQGLSVGGEYVGSSVFLAETAPPRNRGLLAGFSTAGLFAGVLLGSAAGALTSYVLTAEQLQAWGWRVPFLAGLLLGGIALVFRLSVDAGPTPEKTLRAPIVEAVTRHMGAMLHAVAMIMTLAAGWYVLVVYLPTWMVGNLRMDRTEVLQINAGNVTVAIIAGLIAASVSDRIGRKPVLLATQFSLAALTYPLFLLFDGGHSIAVIAVAQGILVVLIGCFAFVMPAVLAEMFPWRVRTTAASFALNLSMAIFGGTAPMIGSWLVGRTGGLSALALYLSALGLCSAIACVFLTERRGVDLSP